MKKTGHSLVVGWPGFEPCVAPGGCWLILWPCIVQVKAGEPGLIRPSASSCLLEAHFLLKKNPKHKSFPGSVCELWERERGFPSSSSPFWRHRVHFGKEEGLSLRSLLCFSVSPPPSFSKFLLFWLSEIFSFCSISQEWIVLGIPGLNQAGMCLSQITFLWHQQAPAAWEESA